MDSADSFKSETLERDCGGCMTSPFYGKYSHYTPATSPHEFVIDFFKNYNDVDSNTTESVVTMIREVKKVYNCHRRMLHTVFSTRKFTKMELMNLPKNHFNDENINWEKIIEVFTLGKILQEIAESRIDMELYYDIQDMLIYTLKHVDSWFIRIGGWGNFVKLYKNSKYF
jgi:hypothetical protein